MKAAIEGVHGIFTASGPNGQFYAGVGGRLYFRRAPQNVVFPYGVFFIVTGSPEYYFSSSPEIQRLSFQFSLFSKTPSSDELETLSGYLRSLYDTALPSVSGWSLVSWKRVLDIPMPTEEVDGLIVHQNIFQYDLIVNK